MSSDHMVVLALALAQARIARPSLSLSRLLDVTNYLRWSRLLKLEDPLQDSILGCCLQDRIPTFHKGTRVGDANGEKTE